MKEIMKKAKWIIGQTRSSALYLILKIVLGGILSVSGIYKAIVLKKLIDSSVTGQSNLIIRFIIVLLLLIIVNIGLQIISSLLSAHVSTNITNKIQRRLYIHISQSKWFELSQYHSGDLLSRITSDINAINNVLVNTKQG